MLTATGSLEFCGAELKTRVMLTRAWRAHVMARRKLLFDSDFAVPAKPRAGFVNLYLFLDGQVQLSGEAAASAPLFVLFADGEYEAASGDRRRLRTWGEPCSGIDWRLRREDVLVPVGLEHGARPVPAAVVEALAAVVATTAEGSDRTQAVAAMDRLIAGLASAGLVAPTLNVGRQALAAELSRYAAVWRGLERLYARHETSPYLDLLSDLTGRSLRQLDRDFRAVCDAFGLHGSSFRATVKVLRLRRAVLLLGAPSATPRQVAEAVGYGSVEALARAFRDAGLPPPSSVREALTTPPA